MRISAHTIPIIRPKQSPVKKDAKITRPPYSLSPKYRKYDNPSDANAQAKIPTAMQCRLTAPTMNPVVVSGTNKRELNSELFSKVATAIPIPPPIKAPMIPRTRKPARASLEGCGSYGLRISVTETASEKSRKTRLYYPTIAIKCKSEFLYLFQKATRFKTVQEFDHDLARSDFEPRSGFKEFVQRRITFIERPAWF